MRLFVMVYDLMGYVTGYVGINRVWEGMGICYARGLRDVGVGV